MANLFQSVMTRQQNVDSTPGNVLMGVRTANVARLMSLSNDNYSDNSS